MGEEEERKGEKTRKSKMRYERRRGRGVGEG